MSFPSRSEAKRCATDFAFGCLGIRSFGCLTVISLAPTRVRKLSRCPRRSAWWNRFRRHCWLKERREQVRASRSLRRRAKTLDHPDSTETQAGGISRCPHLAGLCGRIEAVASRGHGADGSGLRRDDELDPVARRDHIGSFPQVRPRRRQRSSAPDFATETSQWAHTHPRYSGRRQASRAIASARRGSQKARSGEWSGPCNLCRDLKQTNVRAAAGTNRCLATRAKPRTRDVYVHRPIRRRTGPQALRQPTQHRLQFGKQLLSTPSFAHFPHLQRHRQ